MPAFQLVGLPAEPFAPLFDLPDDALLARGIMRCTATESPGFPCRISLRDAEPGEDLLLLPYEHHPAASPYRALGPIYVRRGAMQCTLAPGEVPAYVTRRLISLRAYDRGGMMLEGDVQPGDAVGERLEQLFADPAVAYVHLHNARRGCYSCLARRA